MSTVTATISSSTTENLVIIHGGGSLYVTGSQTLSLGGKITTDGEVISLANPSNTQIEIPSTASGALPTPTTLISTSSTDQALLTTKLSTTWDSSRDQYLGPLTTIFTAPQDCNNITVSAVGPSSYGPVLYYRGFSSIASSCFPSGYPLGPSAVTSIITAYGDHDEHAYYSPGICPSDWVHNTVGVTGPETTAFCCQPGFQPITGPPLSGDITGVPTTVCQTTISSTVITTVAYTQDGVKEGYTRPFTFAKDGPSMQVKLIVEAYPVWIRYREGDFTSRSSPTSTTSIISLPTRNHNSGSTLVDLTSSRFTTGMKAGIGVGVSFTVLLAVAGFAFFLARKRKSRAFSKSDRGIGEAEVIDVSEVLDGTIQAKETRPLELDAGSRDRGNWVPELDGRVLEET